MSINKNIRPWLAAVSIWLGFLFASSVSHAQSSDDFQCDPNQRRLKRASFPPTSKFAPVCLSSLLWPARDSGSEIYINSSTLFQCGDCGCRPPLAVLCDIHCTSLGPVTKIDGNAHQMLEGEFAKFSGLLMTSNFTEACKDEVSSPLQ